MLKTKNMLIIAFSISVVGLILSSRSKPSFIDKMLYRVSGHTKRFIDYIPNYKKSLFDSLLFINRSPSE